MTHEEFQAGATRLISVYGKNAFPLERLEIMWRTVRYVSARVWNETVSEVIGEYISVPSITKIKDALYAVRKKLNLGETDFWSDTRQKLELMARERNLCRDCLNSGLIAARRRADPHQYLRVFGCHCAAGGLAMSLPEHKNTTRQWNIAMRMEWRMDHEPDTPAAPQPKIALKNLIAPKDLNAAIGDASMPTKSADFERWDLDE